MSWAQERQQQAQLVANSSSLLSHSFCCWPEQATGATWSPIYLAAQQLTRRKAWL